MSNGSSKGVSSISPFSSSKTMFAFPLTAFILFLTANLFVFSLQRLTTIKSESLNYSIIKDFMLLI